MRYVVFLLLCATSLAAQEQDCADPMTQLAMNICAHKEWQLVDAELNATYRKAVEFAKSLDTDLPVDEVPALEALRQAQRAWIAFRDLACRAESLGYRGGSIQPLIYSTCLTQLTKERIGHLRSFSETY